MCEKARANSPAQNLVLASDIEAGRQLGFEGWAVCRVHSFTRNAQVLARFGQGHLNSLLRRVRTVFGPELGNDEM